VRRDELKGVFYMLLATIIWSFSAVMMKSGTDDLAPWTFCGIRSTLGCISMLPLVYLFDIKGKDKSPAQSENETVDRKLVIRDSLLLGISIGCYMVLAQAALAHTTVGKSGFITALYIIIVPFMGFFLHKRPSLRIWLCVSIAMVGFYLMCMTDGFSAMNRGDIMLLIGSFFCAIQLYLIDSLAKRISPMKLTFLQFFFAGIFCMTGSFIFEHPTLTQVFNAMIPLLYTGVVSCGFGYMFQAFGQKYVEPMKASLLFSSETIFTMFFGLIFYHEIMSFREYFGCGLIFFAIVYSLIEPKKDIEEKSEGETSDDK